jgi:hypothetical protein
MPVLLSHIQFLCWCFYYNRPDSINTACLWLLIFPGSSSCSQLFGLFCEHSRRLQTQVTYFTNIGAARNDAPLLLIWYRQQIQFWQLQQSHYYGYQAYRTHEHGNFLSPPVADITGHQIYGNFPSVNSLWAIPHVLQNWLPPEPEQRRNQSLSSIYKAINHILCHPCTRCKKQIHSGAIFTQSAFAWLNYRTYSPSSNKFCIIFLLYSCLRISIYVLLDVEFKQYFITLTYFSPQKSPDIQTFAYVSWT